MNRNLNYNVDGSRCYADDQANCDTYGRLYDWATAMALPTSCNANSCASLVSAKHRGICPMGWHIPTDTEWRALISSAGGSSVAGSKLKATSGWRNCGPSDSGNDFLCEDTYGFSALPGGAYNDWSGDWRFMDINKEGNWWSATRKSNNTSFPNMSWYMLYNSDIVYSVEESYIFFSVRCLKD